MRIDWLTIVAIIVIILTLVLYYVVTDEYKNHNCKRWPVLCWGAEPRQDFSFTINFSEYEKEVGDGKQITIPLNNNS